MSFLNLNFFADHRLSVQFKLRYPTNDDFGGSRTVSTLSRNNMGPEYGKPVGNPKESKW